MGRAPLLTPRPPARWNTNLRDVTMTGDTTFGAPNGGRWDLRVRSSTGPGPGLRGNGHKLTKVGSGFVSIACQRDWRHRLIGR